MKRDKSLFKTFQINKKVLYTIGGVAAVVLVTASVVCISKQNGKEEEVVYRETTVEYGNLTVGITEDSSVSIGTLNQNFDLDISALVSNDSSSSSTSSGMSAGGGMGFAMDMGGGSGSMTFSFGGSSFSSESQEMEVESVNISVGQEIQAGDVLYTLTQESVDEIRSQLEEDVTDTLAEYDALVVEQQEDRLEAEQGYDTYVLNGKLAQLEYELTVAELEEKAADAEALVTEKQNLYNENLAKIVELQEELKTAQVNLNEANFAVLENYADRYNNAYYYTVFENTREVAQKLVDNLTDEIQELVEENEDVLAEIDAVYRDFKKANRELESGKLTAQQTLDTDSYYASAASEWYAIQTENLDSQKDSAYSSYESAVEKLEEFNTYINGNDVIAEYSGVVTEVPLSAGDSVTRNTSLVTMYDKEDVTMEVSLSEDDYEAIDQSGVVQVYYDAYPDAQFTAQITEVSDAEYDSDTGTVYYTLTITMQGDVDGLYEGMTGEVTFVTKETRDVLYVSNRAIIREGTRSYVKVYDESGKVVQKEITTGFSDGVNVEIVEGLSEGDVVLIESKVSES